MIVADIDGDAHALDRLRSAMAPSVWTVWESLRSPAPERDLSRLPV